MKISEQLKKFRKKADLKIVDCANKIKVSQSTYRDWEQGRSISGEPYLKIAKLFNVSLSELFGLSSHALTKELSDIQIELENVTARIKNIRSNL